MRLGPKIISAVSLFLAAIGCWIVATLAANTIETRSGDAVRIALIEAGHEWADVNTDGLQVHIGGIAPTEAQRFNALHIAGTMVEATRIVDGTTVTPTEPLAPPKFSIEIMRNDEGVTLIGLVPESFDREATVKTITEMASGAQVTDLLEVASYPEPRGWDASVQYGLTALSRLPRSKVSISSGRVTIDAIADSEEQKQSFETLINRRVPSSVNVRVNITAPRPVVTPFTLRFLIDDGQPRFDACSVDTERNQGRILQAAAEAGLTEGLDCTLALGVPSPDWTNATILGIKAVSELGGGSITYADADVTLIAPEETPQAVFDRIVGELESNLPDVFSLHSVLPEPATPEDDEAEAAPPEFSATRSPEGQVQLRGRLNNPLVRNTVESYAKARFGVGTVYTATRIDDGLPEEWPVRVLAGLEALTELEHGSVTVTADFVDVRGTSGNADSQAAVARTLEEKLGNSQKYAIDVTYDESLDPVVELPTPEECIARVIAVQAQEKISFEPGSTEVAGSAIRLISQIADILKSCRDVEMEIEIAGHTDSQGREEMNLDLSQARADSVLQALIARRVLTSGITARGYGESEPIADNDIEEGREANRRIEFRLVTEDEDSAEAEEGSDEAAEDAEQPEEGAETDEADAPEAEGEAEELDATSGAAPASNEEADDQPADDSGDGDTEDTQ
ncbi:OmpA family protein [Tropicimonas sediminicola]|uniref:OmpA-OmpF porin, OOP family n=1 Tax=Tropicimonas sediminicola TaxID=1031541 RepID=A0A239C4M9_9RHOB|nr:OmpA family protein [Tropicimonas sediminicola]SNS14862.1 OmpA-OmpF porin, OOP family [Tropicimonas sediminicola]